MTFRCACCDWPTPERYLINVRLGQITDAGLRFIPRLVCRGCVSRLSYVMPDELLRDMTLDTLERMHQAATEALVADVKKEAAADARP